MRQSYKRQRGFTLIELSVVLLVIGLILGAVSIGRDLQRQAEYKSIAHKFLYQWKVAYDAYYEKAGVVLGDSQIAPTYAINGNDAWGAFIAVGTGDYGSISVDDLPRRICADEPNDNWGGHSNADIRGVDDTATRDLHFLMKSMGIRMPPGRAEGLEDRYVYLDTNGNPQEIAVCFQWNPPETPSGSGNMMVIVGLTPDLARMLDQWIDGKPDAREGMFREQGMTNDAVSSMHAGAGAPNSPGIEWGASNSQYFGQHTGQGPGDGGGRDFDEDQIITITAHWKMNQ